MTPETMDSDLEPFLSERKWTLVDEELKHGNDDWLDRHRTLKYRRVVPYMIVLLVVLGYLAGCCTILIVNSHSLGLIGVDEPYSTYHRIDIHGEVYTDSSSSSSGGEVMEIEENRDLGPYHFHGASSARS